MLSNRITIALYAILFLISIYLVNWQSDRTEFVFISGFYSIAFATYLLILKNQQKIKFNHLIIIAGVAHLISMLHQPNLSIDYYRFIWDGELFWAGYNPFDYTPQELVDQGFLNTHSYLKSIYEGIGPMSQKNYSCYPPLNQGYFILSTSLTNSVIINTITLKSLIVATEVLGAIYLYKLLSILQIDKNRMWMLFLNPLWIIECTGNAHFEGVMVSFIFVALYFVFCHKMTKGGLFFAFAVQIKLIPLMILPFFYRFLGFGKSILFYGIVLAVVIVLSFTQLNPNNYENFMESLRLYFQVFEFNSFILHYYVQFGIAETGWNMTRIYGPQLSKIAIALISILALYGQISSWKKLFRRITIGFFVYLLLSSTLHPWYILPMLALSVFTNYSYPLLWSFLIFFSYIFYKYDSSSHEYVRIVVLVEYILVLGLFIYEMINKKSPFKFLRLESYQEKCN